MKKANITFIIALILASCNGENEVGKVMYKIRFTTESATNQISRVKSISTEQYSNFGTYITSLTPTKFAACLWTIGYCDGVMIQNSNATQLIQFIDQNPDHLPSNDPSRYVDFTNNVTINFEHPVMFGRLKDNILSDKNIDFKYFYFMPYYIYQEIPLPDEYKNVELNQWLLQDNAVKENNLLKTRHSALIRPIFPMQPPTFDMYFYFGNTDSSFVANPNREAIPTSVDNPMILMPTQALIIRSSKYTKATYHAPIEGQTITLSGTVSFNTNNLIQVYAGTDNLPYTSDDVFVYAPRFWERISSNLEIK